MPPEDGARWTDAWLDKLNSRVEKLEERAEALSAGEVRLRILENSLTEVSRGQAALVEKLDKRREEAQQERKSDRRWLVGTALTSAALVIASMNLLAGQI